MDRGAARAEADIETPAAACRNSFRVIGTKNLRCDRLVFIIL